MPAPADVPVVCVGHAVFGDLGVVVPQDVPDALAVLVDVLGLAVLGVADVLVDALVLAVLVGVLVLAVLGVVDVLVAVLVLAVLGVVGVLVAVLVLVVLGVVDVLVDARARVWCAWSRRYSVPCENFTSSLTLRLRWSR